MLIFNFQLMHEKFPGTDTRKCARALSCGSTRPHSLWLALKYSCLEVRLIKIVSTTCGYLILIPVRPQSFNADILVGSTPTWELPLDSEKPRARTGHIFVLYGNEMIMIVYHCQILHESRFTMRPGHSTRQIILGRSFNVFDLSRTLEKVTPLSSSTLSYIFSVVGALMTEICPALAISSQSTYRSTMLRPPLIS